MWDRGGNNAYSSAMHKTETVDYGIVLAGERMLVLDDCKLMMKPGDIVVQVGAWHQWACPKGAMMAFDMMAARFVDGRTDSRKGNDKPIRPARDLALPGGVQPARRIVTIDREPGQVEPRLRRPGARRAHRSGASGLCVGAALGDRPHAGEDRLRDAASAPHARAAGAGHPCSASSRFPPDDAWKGKVGAKEVEAYFRAMGSPGASTYTPLAPHPYMQKTRTLDFCSCWKARSCSCWTQQEVTLEAGRGRRATRHQPRLEQPLRRACGDRHRVARRPMNAVR